LGASSFDVDPPGAIMRFKTLLLVGLGLFATPALHAQYSAAPVPYAQQPSAPLPAVAPLPTNLPPITTQPAAYTPPPGYAPPGYRYQQQVTQTGYQAPSAAPTALPAAPPAKLAAPTPAPASPAVSQDDLKARIAILEQRLEAFDKVKASDTKELKPASDAAKPVSAKEYEVGADLKMNGRWQNGLRFETADKAFKWSVGGTIQFDMSFFQASDNMNAGISIYNNYADPFNSLQDGFQFRRARLRFMGEMYEQFEFFAQYEFAQALDLRRRTLGINPTSKTPTINDFDPGDDVGFNEVYFGITKLPFIGNVRVGRHRESLNFVTATADNNQVWMERGLMFDAFNGDFNFSNGVTVQNTGFDDRVYGLFGFFHSNNNSNRSFYAVGDGEYAYDGRLTALPVYDEENQTWVHVGADYSHRNPHDRQLRYRARPMIRTGASYQTPNIVNSGTIFTQDNQQIANLEYAMAFHRFTFAAEATTSWVPNAYTGGLPLNNGKLPAGAKYIGTYTTHGGYVEALWFLTPDHRKYQKDRPGYARVTPTRNFYLLKGEDGRLIFSRGAWEVGARYDYVDLINNGVNGGASNAATVAVNWYLTSNARIQANYFWQNRVFAPNDLAGRLDGEIQGFGIRFNCDF